MPLTEALALSIFATCMSCKFLIKPRAYQLSAIKAVYRQKRFFLAFEMGSGKTLIALQFIGTMLYHSKIAHALVIAPLTVLEVWEDEIEKNWPEHRRLTYALLRPDSKTDWRRAGLVITNYDYARRIKKDLAEWAPDVVVLDESHKAKNPHAKQSKMAHLLGNVCRYAICLTGTPIGNKPLDLWSQFKFLMPGLLEDSFREFKDHYSIWGGAGGFELKKFKNLGELAKIIRPYTRSMKKKDFLQLPDKNFIEVPVEMGEKARAMYKTMEEDFVAYVTKETVVSAPIALAKLTKLSQISGGFIRDTEQEENHDVHRAKLEVLKGLTDDLLDQEVKRVVIFARFVWEIEEIKKMLAEDWVTFVIRDMATSAEKKMAVSLFNESGGAMICQIAASVGANYQSANYMIFYSMDYSFINFAQAQDRIHRIGQSLPCFYYILMCKGTLDRRIYRVLKQKRNVADHMMDLVKKEAK